MIRFKKNQKEIKMLYMWQEEYGKPFYRFQTNEKDIADKLKRRQNFKLVSYGLNCPLWVFLTTINRPDNARRMFKHISGGKIKFNSDEDIYESA